MTAKLLHKLLSLVSFDKFATRKQEGFILTSEIFFIKLLRQFIDQFSDLYVSYETFLQRTLIIIHRYGEKHSKSTGRPLVTENVIEASSYKSVDKLASQTDNLIVIFPKSSPFRWHIFQVAHGRVMNKCFHTKWL